MADEKKIKVSIESDADTKPVDDYAAAHERLEESFDDAKASIVDLQDNVQRLEEDQREAEKFAEKQAANQEARMNRRANQAQVLVQLAQGLAQASEKLKQSAEDIGKFDEELGSTIGTLADFGTTSSSVINNAAIGFAVGGPLGAAIGGLTGTVKGLFDAWVDGQEVLAESHKRQQEAVDGLTSSLELLGDEQAAGQISRFQLRLQGELKALQEVNEEIQHNLELQAIRENSDKKLRDIQLTTQTQQIGRDVRAGNKSKAEGAVEIASLELEGLREQLFAPLKNFEGNVANLTAEIDTLEDKLVALSKGSEEVRKLGDAAQESLDSDLINESSESMRELLTSSDSFIKEMGAEMIKTRAGLEAIRDRSEAEAERISEEFSSAVDQQADLKKNRDRALEKMAEMEAGLTQQFEAKLDQKTKEVADTIEQGADNIFKAVIPLLKTGLDAADSVVSEEGKRALQRVEKMASDTTNDYLQIGQFAESVQTLQRETGARLLDLMNLTQESIRFSQTMRGDIKRLEESLRQNNGG